MSHRHQNAPVVDKIRCRLQSNQDPLPVAYCVLIKRSKRSKKKSLVVFSNGEVGVKNVYIVYFYTCDGYDIFETHA